MTLDELRSRLSDLRKARAVAREKVERAHLEFAALAPGPDAEAALARLESLRVEADRLRAREIAAFQAEADPRQLVPQLNGAIPILLVPLRVQTRFKGSNLLIRVYPDDFSVQSHEPRLTAGERAAGEQYWSAPEVSNDLNTSTRKEIWRGIVTRFELRRAAWIIHVTNPDSPQIGETVDQPLRVPAAWTLPERLVFRFYGQSDHLLGDDVLGQIIPDGLEMGFDPTRTDGLKREGGELQVSPEVRWQSDFDEAIKVGMGVSVPLDRIGNPRRIERLVVLGVRVSNDEKQSGLLLEQLIQDHQYTDGFSIIPQGTPTNVTNDSDMPAPVSPDDMLDWLNGHGAFTKDVKTLYEDECDGLRLAHALGVSPEVLRYIEHADQGDGREAIAMKRALWAGTLGYYAQQMLAPLLEDRSPRFDPAKPERLILAARFFFTHFVFGRGPLPAFRVGSEPYGILPVSGDMLNANSQAIPAWGDDFLDAFIKLLHEKMLILSRAWINLIPSLPTAGAGANANARLLDVLAMQASSVEWHAERLIGREYLREYTDFKNKSLALDAFAQMLGARFSAFQADFPNLVNDFPRVFDLVFFGGFWQSIVGQLDEQVKELDRGLSPKLTGDVIDNMPFSEVRGIDPAYPNYIQWILGNRFEDVRRGLSHTNAKGQLEPVTALLFMAMRHSYLYEHAFTAMRLFRRFKINSDAGRPYLWSDFAEKELYNVRFAFETTYWDYVTMPDGEGWPLGSPQPKRGSVLQLVQSLDDIRATVPDWKTYFGDIDELFRSLKGLADPAFPTARLERLFAEHIDLASYRLDAWLTAYVYQRLLAYRAWGLESRADRRNPLQSDAPNAEHLRYDLNHRPLAPYATGIYLGAYGWLEGIERGPAGTIVEGLPAELKPGNNNPVTRDPDNYGLIHAPALNHAVTAAILRSASVTQPDTDAYNIDLSSTRTRDALWIIDGVRNGQSPAALLGYRFERALRESDPQLQQWLPELRATFPMPRQPDTDPGAAEAIPARDVVNGLLILQARNDKTLATKLAFAGADRAVMLQIADRIQDTFDACGDLMLAESVHQAAQGNYDRAGGVVTAAGEFTHVPSDFAVVETPRSGTALSHRVLLAMDAVAANQQAVLTPRARLEPGLNQWVGSLIGALSNISCHVTYVFIAEGGDAQETFTVALDELGIEPIDLLFITDDRVQSDLNGRLDTAAREQFEVAHPDVAVKEVIIDTGTMRGQAALLDRIRNLLTAARPGTVRDFVPPSTLHGAKDQDAIDGIDEDELLFRVLGVKKSDAAAHNDNSLWTEFENTLKAFDAFEDLDEDALRTLLLTASHFGIPEAVPQLPAAAEEALSTMKTQAASVKAVMATRMEAALTKWKPPTAPEKGVLQVCSEVTETLLGGTFPLMPHITLPGDLHRLALDEEVDDWLFRTATARENIARLQHSRVVAEELIGPFAALQVFQWPTTQNNWIAREIPAGAQLGGDLVSIVVQPAGAFNPANTCASLMIDEWHEVIPNEQEVTGISFHYDAPNAEPPQALLLAVSQRLPNNNLRWMWEELVSCVNQALVLAKMRAVGPDELRRTRLDAVLPATLAAESSIPVTISNSWFANAASVIAQGMYEMLKRT